MIAMRYNIDSIDSFEAYVITINTLTATQSYFSRRTRVERKRKRLRPSDTGEY